MPLKKLLKPLRGMRRLAHKRKKYQDSLRNEKILGREKNQAKQRDHELYLVNA